MTHAEICPICNGKGTISEDYGKWGPSTAEPNEKVCHGCGGKGWIEVSDPAYSPYTYTISAANGCTASNSWW